MKRADLDPACKAGSKAGLGGYSLPEDIAATAPQSEAGSYRAPANRRVTAAEGETALNRERQVSIVVNNYNYARFLGEAIDSALAQTYPHVEVVVVDDGSTDDSREVIARYGERVVAVLKENGGQASAFNAGFAASGGEIVIFLDADDVLQPEAVERVVAAWRPGVAKVQYRLELIDEHGEVLGRYLPALDVPLPDGDLVADLLRWGHYVTPPTSGNAFARGALAEMLPMPTATWRLCADVYLQLLAPFAGRVVSIAEPLAGYRLHGSNSWQSKDFDADRIARSLRINLQMHELLTAAAAKYRLRAEPEVALNHPAYVANRINLALLEHEGHPDPLRRVRRCASQGLKNVWRYPHLKASERVSAAAWLLAVILLPRGITKRVAGWRVNSASRPRLLRRTSRQPA